MRRAIVKISRSAVTLIPGEAEAETVTHSVAWHTPEALSDALKVIGQRVSGRGGTKDVVIHLMNDVVQRRRLTRLPRVSNAQLLRVISLDRVRYFRDTAEPLLIAVRWEQVSRAAQPSTAVAAAAPVWLVDVVVTTLSAGGVAIDRVSCEIPGLTFRSPMHQGTLAARNRETARRLYRLAGVLAVMAIVAYHTRLYATDVRTSRELSAIHAASSAVGEVTRLIQVATEQRDSVLASHRRRQAVASRLAVLGAALPDSAYVVALGLSGADAGRVEVMTLHGGELAAVLAPAGWQDSAPAMGTSLKGPGGWARSVLLLAERH